MKQDDPDHLREAVENMHGGSARLVQALPITERSGDKIVWEGVVYVFDLENNPQATRAYA